MQMSANEPYSVKRTVWRAMIMCLVTLPVGALIGAALAGDPLTMERWALATILSESLLCLLIGTP